MQKPEIALITGSSQGIGRQIALTFASQNIHVILTGRNAKNLENTAQEIKDNNGQCTVVNIDLCDLNKINELSQLMIEKFNKINYLVCNATEIDTLKPINDQNISHWLQSFHVNVHAHFLLLKNLHTLLIQSKGTIIGVTDERVTQNPTYWSPYSISKNALKNLLETYQKENQDRIRVKFFSPMVVKTALNKKIFPNLNNNLPETVILKQKILNLLQ